MIRFLFLLLNVAVVMAMLVFALFCIPCCAQDVFTSRGVHRNIPEFILDKNRFLMSVDSEKDMLDLRQHLRLARTAGHQEDVISTLSMLGALMDREANFFDGQRYHDEALQLAIRLFPDRSPALAAAYHNQAANRELQKHFDEAVSAYGKALGIWQRQEKIDKAKTALEYFGLARCFEAEKLYDAAISGYKKALRDARESDAVEMKQEILQELSSLLSEQGKVEEAADCIKEYNKTEEKLRESEGDSKRKSFHDSPGQR